MIGVEVEVVNSPEAVLDSVADGINPAMARAALRAANYAGGAIAEVITERFSGGRGNLARSFLPAKFIERSGGQVSAGALSDLIYADIQDQGGDILPKTVSKLAIPLPGSSRARRMWPRDWPRGKLFAFTSRRGNRILGERRGRGPRARLVIHYVLKPMVRILGKNYIAEAKERSATKVNEIFTEAIQESINRGVRNA